jgi:hypothetical protein
MVAADYKRVVSRSLRLDELRGVMERTTDSVRSVRLADSTRHVQRAAPSPRSLATLGMTLFLILIALPMWAGEPLPIQDNSFLIEEAYNQDPFVVQHIFGMMRDRDGHWTGTFTEEWPAAGLKHQLSYTLPLDQSSDILLNYRYQLLGNGDARVACAPRLSLIAGSIHDRHFGFQAMVPVSVVVTDRVVTHWNGGVTREHGESTWIAGASAIYAILPEVHFMLENLWTSDSRSLIVSPGVRWAYDRPKKLQIVPGVAFPINTRDSHDRSVFLYLSFEHPFGAGRNQ